MALQGGPEVCDRTFYSCSESRGNLPGALHGPSKLPRLPANCRPVAWMGQGQRLKNKDSFKLKGRRDFGVFLQARKKSRFSF